MMHTSLRLGRIAGIPIEVHYSWLLIATLITFSLVGHFATTQPDWPAAVVWAAAALTAGLFFVALVVHELAHAVVARRMGLGVRSITLFALGGVARIDDEASTAGDEFWIAIAGPIASVAIGFACLWSAWSLGWTLGVASGAAIPPAVTGSILGWLGYINVVLAIFNLIPAYPLDGGRVLRALLWRIGGDQAAATRWAAAVGQGMAFLLVAAGLLQFFGGASLTGLWLAFIGWFLLEAARAGYLQAAAGAELQDVPVRDLMTRDCAIVDGQWSLQEFVDHVLLRTGRRCFLVRRADEFIGLITPVDVQRVAREEWPLTAVASAATPLQTLHTVSPDSPASAALRIMRQRDVHQLPVLDSGRLTGVITRGHLLQLIDTRTRLSGRDRTVPSRA